VRTKANVRGREPLYDALRDRLASLARATEPATLTRALATDAPAALGAIASQLGDVRGLLEGATGPNSPFQKDELLRDLKDAIDGLFVAKEGDRPSTLGELGLSLTNGDIRLDDPHLQALMAKLPDIVAADWPTVVAREASLLFAQGVQALQDKQNQAPVEERLAEQAVHVKAEITRLQTRQTTLLHQQVAFEKQQDALKAQHDTLKKTQRQVADAEPAAAPSAAEPRREAPAAQAPAAPSANTSAPQSPGLLSFGMAN
jgi:flagellar capping protein FliD